MKRRRRRILAALAVLDKLPVWVCFPLGVAVGLAIGVGVMRADLSPRAVMAATLALGVALWLGLTAPRSVQGTDDARASTDEPLT